MDLESGYFAVLVIVTSFFGVFILKELTNYILRPRSPKQPKKK